MKYVLDASAVLALLAREPGHERVEESLADAAICSVNFVEVGTRLIDSGLSVEEMTETTRLLGVQVIAFDEPLALAAAALRSKTRNAGLSLADRACLALALREDAVAITADKAWDRVDVGCAVEQLR